MKIGSFIQNIDGSLIGRVHGLGFTTTAVKAEPQRSQSGKNYFRLIADPSKDVYEIGYAFEKQKDGRTYYSVTIDSPMFPQTVNAALFQDLKQPGMFNLVWNRQETQDARPENGSRSASYRTQTPNLTL